MRIRNVVVAALAVGIVTASAGAQPPRVPPRTGSGAGPAQVDHGAAAGRAEMEARVRDGIARNIRMRLQLTDEQMTQLLAVNQRFDGRRRSLFAREHSVRMEMRGQLAADDRADQKRIGELLDQVMKIQRERLDIVEAEQRELAKFMTPLQRARYQAIHDQMSRRIDEMNSERERGSGPPSARGGGFRPPPPPTTQN